MQEIFVAAWQAELANYPLLILQAAALLGILSVTLLLSRTPTDRVESRTLLYGSVFGITSFALIALASQFFNLPSKPYLSSDLLFLGGLLGGWKGGAITLASTISARLIFGGFNQVEAFLLDMSITAAGGIVAHSVYRKKPIKQFGWREVLKIWSARMACSIFSSSAIFALKLVPPRVSAHVTALQVFGFSTSLLILVCVVALLRADAQIRDSYLQRMQMYRTDLLSGLPNRRALSEYLEAILKRDRSQHVLLTFEIGNLKEMVRILGHDWTDKFWSHLARQLMEQESLKLTSNEKSKCFQLSDLALAFVVKETSVSQIENCQLVPRLYADIMEHLQVAGGHYSNVQLRCGVTNVRTADDANASSVLRNISLALQSSNQQIRYFHDSFSAQADKDAKVHELIIGWIRNVNPPMNYQPKFNLETRAICGAEALLRAHSSEGLPLSPLYVLDVATRYQLLLKLEWCTVEMVIREIAHCMTKGFHTPLSVNISAASITVPDFGDRILDRLNRYRVPFEMLSIEITESGHVPDINTVKENIHKLNSAGVGLSLDDFGAGYSTLTTLAKIPFNEVKIDYAMVSMIEQPRMNKAIGLALESATRYGATLVAEGVETETQLDILVKMGIKFGQGYLFSKAVPINDLIELSRQEKMCNSMCQ
ncbi:EAL domain-containing protein [Variovorax gossypii]